VITEYMDFAQILVYVFWFFFAGLIFYLRREDKREGYPLESDRRGVTVQGWPAMPEPRAERASHPAIAADPSLVTQAAASVETPAAGAGGTGSTDPETGPAMPADDGPTSPDDPRSTHPEHDEEE